MSIYMYTSAAHGRVLTNCAALQWVEVGQLWCTEKYYKVRFPEVHNFDTAVRTSDLHTKYYGYFSKSDGVMFLCRSRK